VSITERTGPRCPPQSPYQGLENCGITGKSTGLNRRFGTM
jgi:hypothetical protein